MKMHNVEDVYVLSPIQQGMLFHVLHAPEIRLYFEQDHCILRGALDVAGFAQAWQQVVARHPILRTAFLWEGLDEPLQLVRQQVTAPWTFHDWRAVSPQEQEIRLADWLAADHAQGINLTKAPLLRLTLIQMADECYHFIATSHHLLLDGWSGALVFQEVFTCYEAACRGVQPALPSVYPYRAYISWLQHQDLATAERFWRQQLQGVTAPTPLGVGHRTAENVAAGQERGQQHVQLSTAATRALQRFAQQHHLTINTLLQGAWAILLSRYSGQADVIFGATGSGRPVDLPGAEQMVGLFISTLPVRVRVDPDARLVPWLKQLQVQQLEARQYEYSPLMQIQKWSEVPAGAPLFESILVFENYAGGHAPLVEQQAGITCEMLPSSERTNFPLTILAVPGPELELRVSYDQRRFEPITMTRALGHLQTLLEQMVTQPDAQVQNLRILTIAERRQVLETWNATAIEYPDADRTLHGLIEAQAARTPNAIALVFEDQTLTYAALNQRANQLAHHLQSLGIGAHPHHESLVGVCMERSLEMVVALLGVLKAGGAYVPIDPAYPPDRVQFMLQDAQTPVLLTQQTLVDQLPEHGSQVLCLDVEWQRIALQNIQNPTSGAAQDTIAYMIYTSGSTGIPKGAMNSHRAIVNRLLWMQAQYHLDASDRVLQKTPFSFDVSVWEFFWPLLTGATLVVARPGGHQDSAYLVELIQQQRITTLHFVPPMLQAVVAEPALSACASLRRVICSGEALPADLPARFFARVAAELHNLYGPTEAAVDVSYWPCDPNAPTRTVPIGWPVANTQLYVLDPQMQPVPIGVAGEVYIGGIQLARGYWRRPALTAEKFVPDPFSGTPGARLYRTGDLGTYRPDGAIEYLGRIDFQVKVRGFRIELGEIEAALVAHAAVREAVVLAREDRSSVDGQPIRQLVAYVVREPSTERPQELEQTLRAFIGYRLPEYMVPSAIMVLDAFPLTANGKLDRRVLPAPDHIESDRKSTFVPARIPLEEVLVAIWAEVLGVEMVGIDDHFFALGGDSIRSLQIVSRARARGLNCSLPQISQHPTVRALARQLSQAAESITAIPPTQPFSLIAAADRARLPETVEDAYPLTQLQAGMLFHSEYRPDTAIYHDIFTFHMAAPFDQRMLVAALAQMSARHPVLRTSFDLRSFGEPLQIVHAQATIPLEVVDLRQQTQEEQVQALRAWLNEEKSRTFNWTQPPLLRFQVHRRSDTTFELAVSFHHIILDGWSVASMLTEFFEHYAAAPGEVEAQPTSTFRDFVALERAMLESEAAQRYWRDKLDGASITLVPQMPASALVDSKSEVLVLDVPIAPQISEGLKQLARSAAVPIKSVLLAAHLRVMMLISGTRDVVTGLVANGRLETTDGERVLGLFLNTLPFRQHLTGGAWLDLIQATFATEQELLPYRRYPMPEIQRMHGGQQIFETAFNFIHFHVYNRLHNVNGLSILDTGGFEQTNFTFLANFALDIEASHVHLILRSDNSAMSEAQLQSIRDYYTNVLTAMVEHPTDRYERQPLLMDAERQQMLFDWNTAAQSYPYERCVHELFAEQAARQPDTDALVYGTTRMSYAELDRRTNLLAHHLQRLGVGPDVLVAVCLERSLELVVTLLAILKAGGAYVPLDPSYPQERLGFILTDTQPRVVLTAQHLLPLLPAHTSKTVCVDMEWPVIAQEPAVVPHSGVGPDHLAYVMYTSGSTGRPKGTCIPHRGVVRLVCNTNYIQLTDTDRIAHTSNISFDAATFELWGALLNGAALVIIDKAVALAPQQLSALLREQQITVLFMTTAWFNQVAGTMPEAVRHLKYLLFGGEASDPQRVQQVLHRGTPDHLLHMYGPTESTTYATWHEVTAVPADAPTIPIGGPVSNTQVYILDPELQPVPIGTTGELYIGGDGLARGYYQRPDLTAEKFIPHLFSPVPGARLYKTGDIVRYLPDGSIEFLSRTDTQVKVRGYRIELGEIEVVLGQHPAVQQAIVLAREDLPGQKYLTAYLIPTPGPDPSIADLRSFLKAELPDYMVPSAFVILEAVPLTPNGKIDRRALLTSEHAGLKLHADNLPPRDALELHLAEIWEDLLHTSPIGVTDNFFDLGGHSLLVVHLMGRISKEFGQDLPLSTLFEAATIEQLANILRERSPAMLQSPLVMIQANGSKRPFFCVHPGSGNVLCYLALAKQLGPDQPFYGLQDPYLYSAEEAVIPIKEMAAYYIKAVQTIQPVGPYQLGGWSFGGVVAFEMAQQLTQQGHTVAVVALLDPGEPSQISKAMNATDDAALLAVIMSELIPDIDRGYLELSDYLRPLTKDEKLQYIMEQIQQANVELPSNGLQYVQRQLQMFKARIQAINEYRPRIYPGSLTLFRATEVEAEYAQYLASAGVSDLMAWSGFSSEPMDTYFVPGEHATMMTAPHVEVLAVQLQACFDQAQRSVGVAKTETLVGEV